ncbi:MAG: hypothetical protein H5U32_03390 [Pseudomonas balearica]|jgi:hypothetical protein|uniref:hypothetical protein n=1 Tax=Stutzerimonas balearica TaxID=74829 RepID=UPI0019B42DFB|nr:hypothetical protein [Stutzerimonas balearica]MBC7198273.1 hypothetical protein [Stutzerimonas balearica]
MELEEKIIELTSKTFSKFCEKLATVDPVAALFVTASAITPVMLGAMAVELLHQKEIYSAGGMSAVNAYLAHVPDGIVNFVAMSVADALPTESMNWVGKSTLALITLPLAASLGALAAGKFQNLKKEIETLEQGGRQIDRNRIKTVEYPARNTCATRLSNSERFDRSMDALSRKIVAIQDQEAAQANTPAGPRQ